MQGNENTFQGLKESGVFAVLLIPDSSARNTSHYLAFICLRYIKKSNVLIYFRQLCLVLYSPPSLYITNDFLLYYRTRTSFLGSQKVYERR